MVSQFDQNRIHSFGAKCEHTSLQELIMFNSRTTSTILMEIIKYYELQSMQIKTCQYLHLHFHASSVYSRLLPNTSKLFYLLSCIKLQMVKKFEQNCFNSFGIHCEHSSRQEILFPFIAKHIKINRTIQGGSNYIW